VHAGSVWSVDSVNMTEV